MIELYKWAIPFFNVIVEVLHAEADAMHPDHITAQTIVLDLNTDGLHLAPDVSRKLVAALKAANFVFNEEDDEWTKPGEPTHGLISGDSDEDTVVWYFFNRD